MYNCITIHMHIHLVCIHINVYIYIYISRTHFHPTSRSFSQPGWEIPCGTLWRCRFLPSTDLLVAEFLGVLKNFWPGEGSDRGQWILPSGYVKIAIEHGHL